MRIEGLKEGIQSGQFPVRMQPKWLNGYGYAVSIFYGDILLYFPAFLRILGLGVQTAYKYFVFFINILSAGIAYYSFKRLLRDEKMGLLGCMLYTTSIYRLDCIYVRAAVGEYCALTFLPLIITAVYEILWQENRKENLRSSWLMGVVGFSGLILTHVISTETTVVAVAVFCLVYWKRTFRKNALLQFVKMGREFWSVPYGLLCLSLICSEENIGLIKKTSMCLSKHMELFLGSCLISSPMPRGMP